MNLALTHLPDRTKEKVLNILEIIKEEADPNQVFLLGNPTIDGWKVDGYDDEGITLVDRNSYYIVILADVSKENEQVIIRLKIV